MLNSRKRKQNGNEDRIRNRNKLKLNQKRIDLKALNEKMQAEIDAVYKKYKVMYAAVDQFGEVEFAWYTSLLWLAEYMKLAGMMAGLPKYVYENLSAETKREVSKAFVAQAKTKVVDVPPELQENFKRIIEEQDDPKAPGVG